MKPPGRDYVRYAIIMVRRNPTRKGWKTLIRRTTRVGDDAAHDSCAHPTQTAGPR
ncbi:hypothetical protein LA345_27775 [Burkholderia vietnamiensis]|nr:hypothetical protein [Burkholderia vietnamiensis]